MGLCYKTFEASISKHGIIHQERRSVTSILAYQCEGAVLLRLLRVIIPHVYRYGLAGLVVFNPEHMNRALHIRYSALFMLLTHVQRHIIHVHVRIIRTSTRILVIKELDSDGLPRVK